MKFWLILLLVFPLAACSSAFQSPAELPTENPADPESSPLPDLGIAPELENEVWLNTDAPLRWADLRGSVVLLEMWTYG